MITPEQFNQHDCKMGMASGCITCEMWRKQCEDQFEWMTENQKLWDSLGEQHQTELKDGQWRQTPSSMMRCVRCGQHQITTPIMKFFDWQPEKFTCYDCQKMNWRN